MAMASLQVRCHVSVLNAWRAFSDDAITAGARHGLIRSCNPPLGLAPDPCAAGRPAGTKKPGI